MTALVSSDLRPHFLLYGAFGEKCLVRNHGNLAGHIKMFWRKVQTYTTVSHLPAIPTFCLYPPNPKDVEVFVLKWGLEACEDDGDRKQS